MKLVRDDGEKQPPSTPLVLILAPVAAEDGYNVSQVSESWVLGTRD